MAYHVKLSPDPRHTPTFQFEEFPPGFRGASAGILGKGKRMSADMVPKQARELSKFKRIPDFVLIQGCWAVSQTFKCIVESLEQDIHQFFPIDLEYSSKTSESPNYYLLNICDPFDAVLLDQSDISWTTIRKNENVRVPHFKGVAPRIVLSKVRISNRHMWFGKNYFMNKIFFSNELWKCVEKHKLKKLSALYLHEIQ